MISIGHGAKSAIKVNANIEITGSFLALQAIMTGSATVTAASATGPYVALGSENLTDIPVTKLADVVWGDNRNKTHDGLHHFTSHSVGAINLPAGATLQGPIYSFKVVQGSVIGYLSQQGSTSSSIGL